MKLPVGAVDLPIMLTGKYLYFFSVLFKNKGTKLGFFKFLNQVEFWLIIYLKNTSFFYYETVNIFFNMEKNFFNVLN